MSLDESPRSCGESLHPASQILIWLAFALCIPWLRLVDLAVIALLASVPQLLIHSAALPRLLRRTRYLLLSLMLVYAFAMPGEALLPAWGGYSPSQEGLLAGAQQALRLLALLVTLAWLLGALPGERVLAGLYLLLQPLARLGVNVDRIAVRVWLTLHYAEQEQTSRQGVWRERLQASLEQGDEATRTVRLEVGGLCWKDYAALAGAALALGMLVMRGVAP